MAVPRVHIANAAVQTSFVVHKHLKLPKARIVSLMVPKVEAPWLRSHRMQRHRGLRSTAKV